MNVQHIILFLTIAGIISGCAAKDQEIQQHVDAEQEEAVIIAPSSLYEACRNLTAGQKVMYSFETSSPVNFNIHYHSKAEGIIHAVKEDGISTASGDMTVATTAIYCCMWSNEQSNPVTLNYEFMTGEE